MENKNVDKTKSSNCTKPIENDGTTSVIADDKTAEPETDIASVKKVILSALENPSDDPTKWKSLIRIDAPKKFVYKTDVYKK